MLTYVCLIVTTMYVTPSALGPRGVHIRQITRAHVTNTKCSYYHMKHNNANPN